MLAGLSQFADISGGIGQVVPILPDSECLIGPGLRAFGLRKGREARPCGAAVEHSYGFAALNGAQNILHPVAKIQDCGLHEMSLY
jgi:hypothetical protein